MRKCYSHTDILLIKSVMFLWDEQAKEGPSAARDQILFTKEPFYPDHQKKGQKGGMMALLRLSVLSRPQVRNQSGKSVCNCLMKHHKQ